METELATVLFSKMAAKDFRVDDSVDELVFSVFEEIWETGYTVVESPPGSNTELVHIKKQNSRSVIGVKPEHLRHTPNLQID